MSNIRNSTYKLCIININVTLKRDGLFTPYQSNCIAASHRGKNVTLDIIGYMKFLFGGTQWTNPFHQEKIYLSVVRAHWSTASVGVGEVVPLIVPGLDQISDGLVPVTSNTHSIIHLYSTKGILTCTLSMLRAKYFRVERCVTFLKWLKGFGPSISWLSLDRDPKRIVKPKSQLT